MKSISKSFPGFDQFYLLGSTGSNRPFIAKMQLPKGCSALELLRGDIVPTETVHACHYMGTGQPRDVIWTTRVGLVIVNEKCVSLFRTNGITGWSTFLVEVRNKQNAIVDGYFGLSVTGRCGEIDNTRCERVLRQFPGGEFPVYKGLYFDESQWDGSDIFCSTSESAFIFVTEHVKSLFHQLNIENVLIQQLTTIERSQL